MSTNDFNKIGKILENMEIKDRPKRRMVEWSEKEDDILKKAFVEHGNKWAKISREYFNGKRSDDACRNRIKYLQQKMMSTPMEKVQYKPVKRTIPKPLKKVTKKEYVERRDKSGRKTRYLVRIGNRGGKFFIQDGKKIQLDRDAKTFLK